MRVLLETTALTVAGGVTNLAFTPKVQHLLEDSDTVRQVTPISGKHLESLVFDRNLTVLPLSVEHSLGLFGLPPHHHGPFDRALIAIAIAENVPLVASDRDSRSTKASG